MQVLILLVQMELETNKLPEDGAAGLRPAIGAARLWAHCLAEPLAGLAHLNHSGVPLAAACASDSDPALACGRLSNLVLLGFPGDSNGGLVPGTDSQHPSVQLVQGSCPFLVLGFHTVAPLLWG